MERSTMTLRGINQIDLTKCLAVTDAAGGDPWKWWLGGAGGLEQESLPALWQQWLWVMSGLLGLGQKTAVSPPCSPKSAWWVFKTQVRAVQLVFFYTLTLSFLKNRYCRMMSHLTPLLSHKFFLFILWVFSMNVLKSKQEDGFSSLLLYSYLN